MPHSRTAIVLSFTSVLFLAALIAPSSATFIVMNAIGEGYVRSNVDQCIMPPCNNRDYKLAPREDAVELNSSTCAISVGSGSNRVSLFDDSKWQFPHKRYQFEAECCSVHHQCYADCSTTKDRCDSIFYNCAIQRCAGQFDIMMPTDDAQSVVRFLEDLEQDSVKSAIDANKLFLECAHWASCYAAQSAESGCPLFMALRNQSCECVLADIDDPILSLRGIDDMMNDENNDDDYDAILDPIYDDDDEDDGSVARGVHVRHMENVFFGAFNAEKLRALDDNADFDENDDFTADQNDNSTFLPIPSFSSLMCPPRSTDTSEKDQPNSLAYRKSPLQGYTSMLFSLFLTTLILLVA